LEIEDDDIMFTAGATKKFHREIEVVFGFSLFVSEIRPLQYIDFPKGSVLLLNVIRALTTFRTDALKMGAVDEI
jgi:hypothetical protein